MSRLIRTVFENNTFSLVECIDGFWLYDNILKQNISMRAKTEINACIEALSYYQKRLTQLKTKYDILNKKVEDFLLQINEIND